MMDEQDELTGYEVDNDRNVPCPRCGDPIFLNGDCDTCQDNVLDELDEFQFKRLTE